MMTIEALQVLVDDWIKEYGVRYFSELTNIALLAEEVGELSSLVARTHGDQSFKTGNEPADTKAAIADEMADVVFVLTCMANQMDIDLQEAISRNMIKKTKRDALRHRNNDKLKPS